MAVPKRKMTKARRDSRRANWKLTAPGKKLLKQKNNLTVRIDPEDAASSGFFSLITML